MLKKWFIPLLLPLQILLVRWLKANPSWVEEHYSQAIYPSIARFFRGLLGWIPFSVGDVIYCLVFISVLSLLMKTFKKKITKGDFLLKILKLVSVAYFIFHAFWGINYYRQPLHRILNLDHQYSTEQLEKVVEKLTVVSNYHHRAMMGNDSLKVDVPYTNPEIFERTVASYQSLEKVFPKLKYTPKSIKESMFSTALIYMGFSGYFNPFTSEAQVSRLVIPYKMPTTSCHEEAHQLGFAKENEANFIGSLACMHSPDAYFQYSGYTFALRYCINDLYRRDEGKGKLAMQKVNKGIRENWKEVREFWNNYQNPTEPLFKSFYNQFLKANNQSRGINSYSYVVALYVNYFETIEVGSNSN